MDKKAMTAGSNRDLAGEPSAIFQHNIYAAKETKLHRPLLTQFFPAELLTHKIVSSEGESTTALTEQSKAIARTLKNRSV